MHNAYQMRGGEDAVAEAEAALLADAGHVVHRYLRHNDEIHERNLASVAAESFWSSRTQRDLTNLVASFQPDVIHVHNTYPLVSPRVFRVAAALEVPTVLTLHNFRLLCPQAMLLRDGRVCEDCVGRVPWRGVVHGCYRGSAVHSAAVAAVVQVHRALGTWSSGVHAYIALNAFCRDKFVAGGLPADRIHVKPNFIDLAPPGAAPRQGWLFVGRLSAEKGVGVLAAALRVFANDEPVTVIGEGPQADLLAQVLPRSGQLGAQPPAEVYRAMRSARALVMPSVWYENHPRTIVEAFACGLPVIASRLGALAGLIEDGVTGLLFNPGDPDDLAARLAWAQAHPNDMARMGEAARAYYEDHWTPGRNLEQLLQVYEAARDARGR